MSRLFLAPFLLTYILSAQCASSSLETRPSPLGKNISSLPASDIDASTGIYAIVLNGYLTTSYYNLDACRDFVIATTIKLDNCVEGYYSDSIMTTATSAIITTTSFSDALCQTPSRSVDQYYEAGVCESPETFEISSKVTTFEISSKVTTDRTVPRVTQMLVPLISL
jgi:hypothetical protein